MLQHRFVEFMPDTLEDGILYVSMEYCTAIHKCVCGCGNTVVTPISPTDWQLKFDGRTISLSPSIGNWSFDCQSHYWIERNQIKWAGKWDAEEIESGRIRDKELKQKFFEDQILETREKDDVPIHETWNWRSFLRIFRLGKSK